MLLLQLCFDIYSILNEEKRIFLRGLICPYTLFVQPVVFDGSVHWIINMMNGLNKVK